MKDRSNRGGTGRPRTILDQTSVQRAAIELGGLTHEALTEHIISALSEVRPKGDKGDGPHFEHLRALSPEATLVVHDIARARKVASEKFKKGSELFFTTDGLRWATPESAARHCAERLKGNLCLDVSCGQGGQALFLSLVCDHVIAFDIDPLNCLLARANAKALGIDNLEVHQLDCLSPEAVAKAERECIVFSDPARPSGSLERTLGELKPDPREVMRAYSDFTREFCFELPPYIDIEKIDFAQEVEYISLDGRLNRLNIYTGELARAGISAVVLPQGHSISGRRASPPRTEVEVPFPERFLYELDHTIEKAGLVGNLLDLLGKDANYLRMDDRRSALLSDRNLSSPFFTGCYEVMGFAKGPTELKGALRALCAGKVTPRYKMDPKDYWIERNHLEWGLDGDVWLHLFRKGQFIIVKRKDDCLSAEVEGAAPGHRPFIPGRL